MDPVIQGLTQSPIVQKLSENEHHVKRFTHDIPDNAPLRSFTKTEVKPFMGTSHPDSEVRFKIPRMGYLNKLYLKVFVKHSSGAKLDTYIQPLETDTLEPGPEYFGSFFNHAALVVGGKEVERLYPENVLFNTFQHKGGVGENMLYMLHGNRSRLDPALRGLTTDFIPGGNQLQNQSFLIPLEFSAMKFHKDSMDTNFLQEAEIVFNKRAIYGYHDVESFPSLTDNRTDASLVCVYHNLHPHFKNQIRNTNFQRESSTLITNGNRLVITEPKRETIAEVVADYGATPPVLGHPEFSRHTYDLDLDEFATDILVTFRKETFRFKGYANEALHKDLHTGDLLALPRFDELLHFKLMVNDKIIYDKTWREVLSEPILPSSLDIQDQSVISQGHESYNYFPDNLQVSSTGLALNNLFARYGRPGACLYRIPLSLFGTDEFMNGGLDMKSLKNVKLIIENPQLKAVDTFSENNLVAQIVVRYKTLTRVDGKTGAISV